MTKYFLLVLFFYGLLVSAQHQDKVDFIRAEVAIEPIASQKKIKGGVTYWFRVKQDVDSVFLDAKNLKFEESYLDDKAVELVNSGKTVTIRKTFKKNTDHKLELFYTATPKQTVYFLGWDDGVVGNEQIWTQGQGKYTSHWLPSFDDMQEKVEFDVMIKTSKDLVSIANGEQLIDPYEKDDHITRHFNMRNPMSSYLLAFAIGNYDKQELISKSGIPIENYYYPEDSLKVEPTYRYTKEIFDFLEKEIGFPYPWQNYKQIPVHDFLYAGMENTTATIFSDQYVIDSTAFVDKNYVNVNAHELAHQWFGDLVTEVDGHHHWLHEGFATYYAQLAEKEIFGDDHYYWQLFQTAKVLEELVEKSSGQALTDPKASSATFYEKGAWALVMLRDQVGDKAFKKGVRSYLKKHQYQNVTIDDFLTEIEISSKQDLQGFKKTWLKSELFPTEEVKTYLMTKNESIRTFYVMKHAEPSAALSDFFVSDYPIDYKLNIIEHFKKNIEVADLLAMLKSSDIKVRQKGMALFDENSKDGSYLEMLQPAAEALLVDKSYVTTENALYKLWAAYPEHQAKYLDQTKNCIGLPNKNVRLLWLTLAIVTNNYNNRNTQAYFNELSSYTRATQNWEVRMGAFQYLNQAVGLNNESLKNLVEACVHHSWQFKKFARNLMGDLLKDKEYRERLVVITKELNDDEKRYMNTKLKE